MVDGATMCDLFLGSAGQPTPLHIHTGPVGDACNIESLFTDIISLSIVMF